MTTIIEQKEIYNLLTGRTALASNRVLLKAFKENKIQLTIEQWSILLVLWEHNGCTQQFLADATQRDKTGITRLIDRMEKEGLVERLSSDKDRRSNLIYLTRKGKSLKKVTIKIIDSTVEKCIRGVDKEKILTTIETFDAIFDNIQKNLK